MYENAQKQVSLKSKDMAEYQKEGDGKLREEKHYSYFCNRKCEYFPCHPVKDTEQFNCLFCYCPLYILGDRCGGNFVYHPNGRKDCSSCVFPHVRENYEAVTKRYEEILEAMPGRMSETVLG